MAIIYIIGRAFGIGDLLNSSKMNLYDMFPFPATKDMTYTHKTFQNNLNINQNNIPKRINQRYHNYGTRKTTSHLCQGNKKPRIQKQSKIERNAFWDNRLKQHSKGIRSGKRIRKFPIWKLG
jgi:hypothetical protein